MMFKTAVREDVAAGSDPPIHLQFVSFEVAPLADGGLRVSLAGTFLDESDFQLLGDEIETLRVSTIDEAVAAIRQGLMDALEGHEQTEH
jgi:hypothetical protein